jgi:methyl-accepting chemotaxis protein
VSEVLQTAQTTTRSAGESKDISLHTRSLLESNNNRLRSAENTFNALSQQIRTSHEVIEELVGRIDLVEETLMASQTIGEHIKVLSVNAAIEAAEAGEKGQGFSVVAQELRELIGDTEKNIRNSQSILSEIRVRSRQTMDAMNRSSDLLVRFSSELESTSRTLEKSMASFIEASTRMTSIAAASAQQQVGLNEMGTAVWDVQSASSQLESASIQLLDSVRIIQSSSAELAVILQTGDAER